MADPPVPLSEAREGLITVEGKVLTATGRITDSVVAAFASTTLPEGGDLRSAVRSLGPIRVADLDNATWIGDQGLVLISLLLCQLDPGFWRLTIRCTSPTVRAQLAAVGLDAVTSINAPDDVRSDLGVATSTDLH